MKKIVLITAVLVGFMECVFAQSNSKSSLRIETGFWKTTYYENGSKVNAYEFFDELESNTNAYYDVQQGVGLHRGSRVLGITGLGAIFVWMIVDDSAFLQQLGASAGLGIATGLLQMSGTNKIDKGLANYHRSDDVSRLDIGIGEHGVGFLISF